MFPLFLQEVAAPYVHLGTVTRAASGVPPWMALVAIVDRGSLDLVTRIGGDALPGRDDDLLEESSRASGNRWRSRERAGIELLPERDKDRLSCAEACREPLLVRTTCIRPRQHRRDRARK